MSDMSPKGHGPSNADIVDDTVQRQWDRFAMPDLSVDPASQRSPRASTSPRSSVDDGATNDI